VRAIAVLVIFSLPSAVLGGVPSPAVLVDPNPAVLPAFHATEIDDLPDPMRSICRITGNGAACQFRFRSDGGLDRLTAFITLRDAFDSPVPSCTSSATISFDGPKGPDGCWSGESGGAIMDCLGLKRGGFSGSDGALAFVWDRIGGRGIASLAVSVHCAGSWEVCHPQFYYTSTDLDADGGTGIIDLGIWAACLASGSQCMSSDYDCDCSVGVLDLGVFAGGLSIPDCD
jgi:hypothetical protein